MAHQKLIALRTRSIRQDQNDVRLAIITSISPTHLFGRLCGLRLKWHRGTGHATPTDNKTWHELLDLSHPYGEEPPRTPTFSDEHIEHWAGVYDAQDLANRGIVFDVFLQAPNDILAELTRTMPLDVAAEAVERDLDDEPRLALRGGRLIENTTHRRPVGRRRLGVA